MPNRYYCDYCDTFLTHDSPSVRKTHCAGRKHKENVKIYYQKWMEDQAQSLIDATTAAFKAKGSVIAHPTGVAIPPPPGLAPPHGAFPPPPGMIPGRLPFPPPLGMPPIGLPPHLPPGIPPGIPPPGLLRPGLPPGHPFAAGIPGQPQKQRQQ